jgi:hypothetical protein
MKKTRFLFALCAICSAVSTLSAQEEPPYKEKKFSLGDQWQSFISPGAGYSVYIPTDQAALGIFHGISTQFIWYTTNNNSGRAPSNFQLYTRVGILKSSKDSVGGLISYVTGATFSFERNVHRAFFVPYFGIELGGLNHRGLGNGFQIAPLLGVQLISTPYVAFNAQASYTYSTREFDRLSGMQATATLNFFFWRD